MTREEAILHLEYLKDFKTPDQVEALNMAIAALDLGAELNSTVGVFKDIPMPRAADIYDARARMRWPE